MKGLDKYDDIKTNIKFIKLVEKHQCLWKHDSPNYTNNHVKVRAWKEIARAINATEERCSRRWRYMRQTYSQYVRSSFPKKSTYYLSPHIDFVRPYIKVPPCVQSNESNSIENKDNSQDGYTDTQTLKRENELAKDLKNEKETPVETDKLLEQQFLELIEGIGEKDTNTKTYDVIETKNITSCSNLKRKIDIHDTEVKAKSSKPIPLKSVVNKNWMFLESILPFVDEMNKKQICRFRRKVMLLLDDVLQNKNIDKPELVK